MSAPGGSFYEKILPIDTVRPRVYLLRATFSRETDMPWNPRVKSALDELLRTAGRESAGYDGANPPAAVFDFDDTCIFGDIGEQALRRQIDNLVFGLLPDHFDRLLPREPAGATHLPASYGGARIADLAADLADHYAHLRADLPAMGALQPPNAIRERPDYVDFVVKMNLLFDALIDTPGVGKAWVYPWTARFFAGLDRATVRAMAMEAWASACVAPIGERVLASPPGFVSRAGAQRVSIRTGVRALPEMAWLFEALRDAGFDAYVVTASLEDVVSPTASHVYGIDEACVFGMRTIMENGRYTDAVDERDGYAITFGPGKTRIIENFVGRAPLLVAGDSDTDHHMLTVFPETRVRLVIDRGQGGAMAELRARGERGEDGVVVQRRDERAGAFVARER